MCAPQLVWRKKIVSTWITRTCTGGKVYIALLQATLHYCKVSRGHERELKRPWEQTLGLNHGPLDAVIDLNNQ